MSELQEALDAAFPAAWRDVLIAVAPFYRELTEAEQERFEDKVQHFIVTKTFGSTRNLLVTDEMKVTVAAAACRLTLNLPWQEYTHVAHVTLRAEPSWRSHDSRIVGHADRWAVTLSWPTLRRGLGVGYHEFAHALDGADGSMDGEAQGPPGSTIDNWRSVIAAARASVVRALDAGAPPPIDAYAARSDVELFAVATEWFFEKPVALRAALPPLYELLHDFYRQDPAAAHRRA